MFEVVVYDRFDCEIDSYYLGSIVDAKKFLAINCKLLKSAGAATWGICDCDMNTLVEGCF